LAAPNKGVHHLQATTDLRAVQMLLGHTEIETCSRDLGVDIEDALAFCEGAEV
jgi:site-specific recombinase XerC